MDGKEILEVAGELARSLGKLLAGFAAYKTAKILEKKMKKKKPATKTKRKKRR